MALNLDIIKYCKEYLEVDKFEDGCVNGLQVEGAAQVDKIITGVSLSRALLEQAVRQGAQMVMVHHGFFTSSIASPLALKGPQKERLKIILKNDLNIAGFHLPLDAHPQIGNNISLCRQFGLEEMLPFEVGFIGECGGDVSIDAFISRVISSLKTEVFAIKAGPKKVGKVAVVSGGASPRFLRALEEGVDTFVCGDVREETVRMVEEAGINFINAGHYNTEKLGIENLGKLVAEKFNVKVEFVDIPNPV